jgi:pantothenate kinase
MECDSAMSEKYAQIARVLNEKYEERRGRLIVTLCGPPGAGKSTTSQRLIGLLAPKTVVLPMDGYHYTKDALSKFSNAEEALFRRGAHWTFDANRFVADLINLKNDSSRDLTFPSFDHSVGDPLENDIIVDKNAEIIIIEGNYLLLDKEPWSFIKRTIADFSIFISVDEDIIRKRVINRHLKAHPDQTRECATSRFESNDLLNAREINETSVRADLIIESQ